MLPKPKQYLLISSLVLLTAASIGLAIWLTRPELEGDVGQRLQAIAAVGSLVATACAAIFAAIQIGESNKAAQNALATELPYLFVDPYLKKAGTGFMITATNHGKSLCVASLVRCWSTDIRPDFEIFLEGHNDEHLLLETVNPGKQIEVWRVIPKPGDDYIVGSLEYVNVFGGVQKTWFRFDLRGGTWTRQGGMHWNRSGNGKVRHHDDDHPKMTKLPPPRWPL